MKQTAAEKPCPCGSQQIYAQCCSRFLDRGETASTAEQLMRSRYSAFATGCVDYLLRTHHPSRQSPDEREQLQQSMSGTRWLALSVLNSRQGGEQDNNGEVEFAAYYQAKNENIEQLHERSRFVREGGAWYYVDGDLLPPVQSSRNDPCWCGSGRKFKKCHGA